MQGSAPGALEMGMVSMTYHRHIGGLTVCRKPYTWGQKPYGYTMVVPPSCVQPQIPCSMKRATLDDI
jgi:hypothetical protein